MSWEILDRVPGKRPLEKFVLTAPVFRNEGLLGRALEWKNVIKKLEEIKYLRY